MANLMAKLSLKTGYAWAMGVSPYIYVSSAKIFPKSQHLSLSLVILCLQGIENKDLFGATMARAIRTRQ